MKMTRCFGVSAMLITTLALVSSAAFAQLKNGDCLDCHSDKTLTKTAASGKEISMFVDEALLGASAHRTNACVNCHADITAKHPDDEIPAKPVSCGQCHERHSQTYGASVHGLAATNGTPESATCQDCHGGHNVVPPTSPASPLHFSRLAETCGGCHEEAAHSVAMSVHGKSVAAGHREAATCTDCHSEHKIQGLKATASVEISEDVCSKCHASERISTKFNMPTDRVTTFFESYHGLASKYGSTLAANCGSCHGVHKILPSSDPASTVHPDNLVATCGKCHPRANAKFAAGKIHVDLAKAGGDIGAQLSWWVRRIYLVLIAGVIGGMIVHNGLLFLRKMAALRKVQPRTVVRMNRSQRIQHALLVVSFVVLTVTGFALKFPDSWLAWPLGSSEFFRQWTHRIAGVVMIVGGVYHIFYVLFVADGKQFVRDMLPRWKDGQDIVTQLLYLFGLSKQRPQFARFGYAEKMEYWAVVWGTVIMGVSGFMIWLKMDVTRFFPRWAIDLATTIHYYEAILACLAIVVWHFYHVIFDPDVYPVNWAWWDGKVSAKWQAHEHPLDDSVEHEPANPQAKPSRQKVPTEARPKES